jgi:6-pyruvoyltetrahydropterin/6-carboxytetrahydropterin synthase
MFELSRRFRFESAHRLPHVPPGHKCARLHGHSFRCDILLRGPLDPTLGWVMDFGDVKAAVQPLIEQLDHRYLNELEGLENPTSEVLARWIWTHLAPRLPGLHAVRILETCNSACTYYGPEPA